MFLHCISHAHTHTQKEEAGSGSHHGSGSGSGSSSSSANLHDEVDFSQCFEDTAILYGVCLVAWVLGGLTFLCAPYHRKSLRISSLHLAKLVSTQQYLHTLLHFDGLFC